MHGLERFQLATAIAVVFVLTAGCAAVTDDPGEGPHTDALASSESATDDLDPDELPPGVTEQGIENASTLAEANAVALVESGYDARLQIGASVTTQDGTRNFSLLQRERVRQGAIAFSFAAERERGGQRERVAVWSNGSTTMGRSERGDDVQYRPVPRRQVTSQLAAREILTAYLAAGNYTISEVERADDGTRLNLTADQYAGTADSSLPSAENVSEFRSTVVVDAQGRIHFARLYLVSERGANALTFALRFDLVELGPVTVDRPFWIDEALAEDGGTAGPALAPEEGEPP